MAHQFAPKMVRKIATILFLNAGMFSHAGEREIDHFDSEKATMGEMREIIQAAAREGATIVRFPNGRWVWHDFTRLELPPLEKPKRREFDARAEGCEDQMMRWIRENEIKAIQIRIDDGSRALLFFMVEAIMTDAKVPYTLVSKAGVGKDRIILSETDGRARLLPSGHRTGKQE